MKGRIIYLVGPSGSGKDSLLSASRTGLEQAGCRIAPRWVTRSGNMPEAHTQRVSPAEFEALERSGYFALHWRANGLAYGVPSTIDGWLMEGADVLVNGSREYWPHAVRRYPAMLTVMLTVRPEVLRRRLADRGRETPEQIEARLARNAQLQPLPAATSSLLSIDNSGALAETTRIFLSSLYP